MPPLRSILVVLGWLLVSATPAAAAQDGVTVDPGSPAAKEYAIPLEAARRAASDDADQAPGSPPPAFGVGIGDQPPDAGAPPAAAPGSQDDAAGAGGHASEPRAGSHPEDSEDGQDQGAAAGGTPGSGSGAGGTALLWSGAGMAAVLLLGLAGGMALRRSPA